MARLSVRVATATQGGVIEARLDAPDGELIGSCEVTNTGGWLQWQDVTCPVSSATGVHALYLVFVRRAGESSRLQVANLASFVFTR